MSRPEHANNLLMCSLEPMAPNDTFEHFPPHVTIQPWFSLPDNMQGAFNNALINTMYEETKLPPIAITAGEDYMFGPSKGVHLRLIAAGLGRLAGLHLRTYELINTFGGTPARHGVGNDYTPHVTYERGNGLGKGETFVLPGVQLVKKDTQRKLNRVVKAWSFNGARR